MSDVPKNHFVNRGRLLTDTSITDLYALQFKAVWDSFKVQHISFWLLCLYFLFEYVRPQSLYKSIDILPWAQMCVIATAIGVVFDQSKRFVPNPITKLFVIFCIIIVLSSIFGFSPANSWEYRNVMLTWVIIYFATTSIVNSETRLFLLFGAYLLFNLKMSQHGVTVWAQRGFGFAGYGINGAPGWFHNSGEYAIQMVIFGSLVISFVVPLRKYLSPIKRKIMYAVAASGYMAVMGASSRGAQLGLAAIGVWWVLKLKGGFKALLIMLVLGVALFQILPDRQVERFREMGTDESSLQRFAYWNYALDEVIPEHPVLGVGHHNWLIYMTFHKPEGVGPYKQVQEPHNIFIQAAAELGYVGLAVFILLILFAFRQNRKTRLIANSIDKPLLASLAYGLDAGLVGYLVAGSFVTVLYYPYFWIQLTFIVTLYSVTHDLAKRAAQNKSVTALSSGES